MTPTDLNRRLGAIIRLNRSRVRISQDALGQHLGVTQQQIAKYESGHDPISFPGLVQIAEFLGTTVTELATAALGRPEQGHKGISERETLELVKWLETLSPNARHGVRLLVQTLATVAA